MNHKDIHKLAKKLKLNVPVIFTEEWEQRNKLRAEGDKLRAKGYKLLAKGYKLRTEGDKLCAEGNKLRAEDDKLYAEGDKLYLDKVIKEVGPKALIDWNTGQVTF